MSGADEEPLDRIARLAHDAANRLFEPNSLLARLGSSNDAATIAGLAGEAGRAIATAVGALREIGAEARAGASVGAEVGSILRATAPGLARAVETMRLPIRAGESELAALRRVIESLVRAESARAGPHRLELAVTSDGGHAELRFHSPAPARDQAERAVLLEPARLRNPESLGGGVSYAASATLLPGSAASSASPTMSGAGRSPACSRSSSPASTPPPARPLTVLVVDDEPGVARAAMLLLESLGHRAVVADSVATARRRLEAGGIDALLVDRRLGGGGGADLVAWVRAAHPARRSRTVVASGAPGPLPPPLDDVPVLPKPFDRAALAARFGAASARS